jgi:2-(1,2-epoxy-1,2-dihydrophenyl)acetyl-CoA isomerase
MTVRLDITVGVATVTLDRPERRNALDGSMKARLLDAFESFVDDAAVRVVVLTGAGGAFCAGSDIGTMQEWTIPAGRRRLKSAQRIVRAIADLEKPVIAAVDGPAVGVGWSLALACDLVFATRAARFGQVFGKVGLAPDGGSAFLLSQLVGPMRAKELVMTARIIDCDEARQLGLVLELAENREALDARVGALAQQLASSAGLALGMTKRLFAAAAGSDLDAFLEFESHVQNQLAHTRDHREGVAAFLEKRAARFEGH